MFLIFKFVTIIFIVKNLISRIDLKLEKLVKKCIKLSLEKENLQKNNDALNVQLQEQKKQFVALQEKVKLMKISNLVHNTDDGVKETRMKINEYVREIDKCIALLNQ